MADTARADGVAAFIESLKTLTPPDWHEAEELLGDGRDKIKPAVATASDAIMRNPARARLFEDSLGVTAKARALLNEPIESGELLVNTVLLAIYAADTISEADYETLVKPMRVAWATIPDWSQLQPSATH